MYKNLSLIDFINLNKGSDYYSKESLSPLLCFDCKLVYIINHKTKVFFHEKNRTFKFD